MMDKVIFKAEQALLETTAKWMSHLQKHYDFSSTTYPQQTNEKGSVGAAGENMARMMILELKQCTNFPLEHLQLSVNQIRKGYSTYLTSAEFRRAMKSYAHTWALLEAERRKLNSEETQWLVSSIDYWANLVLSPVGIIDIGNNLMVQGHMYPLRFTTLEDPEAQQYIDIYQRLPQFLGILDFVDEDTANAIVDMLPKVLASPDWYDQTGEDGCGSTENVVGLHEALCSEYLMLEEKHTIQIEDGFCKTITLAEFEGEVIPASPYRLLVATISYEGTTGEDVYLAIDTPYLCRTVLLVNPELEHESGPRVIRYIYHAFAEAVGEETGEFVDIDSLLDALEEAIDLEEV